MDLNEFLTVNIWGIDIDNPEFDKTCRVHDWRNYVPEELQEEWHNLTERERKIIIVITDDWASREDWD